MDVVNYNRLGQVFTAANTSAKTVSLSSTTATGLILYNPPGSNKLVLLIDWGFAWTTVPGAIQKIGIATAAPSITAPASVTAAASPTVVSNSSGNAGNSLTQAYDAATLPIAPVARRWAAGAAWITGGSGEAPYQFLDHVDGAISLVPGGVLQIIAETTSPVGVGSFTWIEVPYLPNQP